MTPEELKAALTAAYCSAREAAAAAGEATGDAAVSAANLLAYVDFRKNDLARLQLALADQGLSSLGRLEGFVLNSLEHVMHWLGAYEGGFSMPDRATAEGLLAARSRALFGRPRPARDTRIMVTLDHEVPDPESHLRGLLLSGMDIARINGAHGSPSDWRALVEALRSAERHLTEGGNPPPRRCRVLVDLGGPRLRLAGVPGDSRLRAGDTIRLSRTPLSHDSGVLVTTIPAALDRVEIGHRVAIDDGKFFGRVIAISGDEVVVALDGPLGKARRLKPEKGINLPDTSLDLPALTAQDRADLREVVDFADAVGLSFVHRAEDLGDLHSELVGLGRPDLGIVAKIETRMATRRLSSILLRGLSLPAFGVMIARGDLAVEVGFEDMAVMQESILCLCEAAHVPAIWATQVLETLAHSGLPARAEITDAAASHRADCVMLNKGPHVATAAAMLDRLLTAEQRNAAKKRHLFREFIAQD